MNPELERNLWLELTPGRMIVMAVVLALIFFAAALTQGVAAGPGDVARWAYYVVVVIWGARNAANSVVGEIRARTWDSQRLSALSAGTMMWGKLFGSTLLNWFGGAICLAVILADLVQNHGFGVAFIELVYYLAIGVIAQATALLASLIAARRRQGRTQFEVFLYQCTGLAAAVATYLVWSVADPARSLLLPVQRAEVVMWWGQACPAQPFLLLSLALFTGWILTGCWRQMRLELQMRNGPLVWLGFLLFMGVYVAGFDAWLIDRQMLTGLDVAARRFLLVGLVYGTLAFVMVLLEPKDRVRFRWLGAEFGKLRFASALANLQGWMTAYLAALLAGIALLVVLGWSLTAREHAFLGALLGFLTRDVGIVVAMSVLTRRRGGDFMALAVLFLLYALLPAIFASLNLTAGLALWTPRLTDPVWLSPLAGWTEAVLVWAVTVAGIALPEKQSRA